MHTLARRTGYPVEEFWNLTLVGRYGVMSSKARVFRNFNFASNLRCPRCGDESDPERYLIVVVMCIRCGGTLQRGEVTTKSERINLRETQAQILEIVQRRSSQADLDTVADALQLMAWTRNSAANTELSSAPGGGLQHGEYDLAGAPPAAIAPFLPDILRYLVASSDDRIELRIVWQLRSLFWPFAAYDLGAELRGLEEATWAGVLDAVTKAGITSAMVPSTICLASRYNASLTLTMPRTALSYVVQFAIASATDRRFVWNDFCRLYGWTSSANNLRQGTDFDRIVRSLTGTPVGRGVIIRAIQAVADQGFVDQTLVRGWLRSRLDLPAEVVPTIETSEFQKSSRTLAWSWLWHFCTSEGNHGSPFGQRASRIHRFDQSIGPDGRTMLAGYVQRRLRNELGLNLQIPDLRAGMAVATYR